MLLPRLLAAFTPFLRERFKVEIIVSDGGSTDNTIDLALADADVVVQHNTSDRQTIAGGRNAGAAVARGAVLVFLNADTLPADVGFFLTCVDSFLREGGRFRNAGAIAFPVFVFPDEAKLFDRLFHAIYNQYVRFLNAIGIGAGRGECQVIRREVFLSVRGYKAILAAGEDFDLYARIRREAKIAFASQVVVYESPRRYRKFGYFRILYWWTLNAVSVYLRGRSSSDEWEPVR